MAYINLNIYEEIEAEDFIDFIKTLDSKWASVSNGDLRKFIDENINLPGFTRAETGAFASL